MQDYVQKTKGMEEEFKLLQKRDRMTSKTIEKRMQELLMFHNQTAYMKSALVIKGCEMRTPVPFFVDYIFMHQQL